MKLDFSLELFLFLSEKGVSPFIDGAYVWFADSDFEFWFPCHNNIAVDVAVYQNGILRSVFWLTKTNISNAKLPTELQNLLFDVSENFHET